jgi:sugar lactone lactonase YvrE
LSAWEPVVGGLAFAEAPRWHDGALWVSDIFGGAVHRWDEVVLEVPAWPSGTGWLPDGRMLVVAMRDRQVLVVEDGVTSPYADLSSVATAHCNDMVVHEGHAWVGNLGYEYGVEDRKPASLAHVAPDGTVSAAAEDVWFPNGMVVAGDTLLLAETPKERITAFTIADDGSLHDRRVWAALDGPRPDGIALDADGGLWVASPGTFELLRVVEGGQVTDRLDPPNGIAQACALAGDVLYVCSTTTHDEAEALRTRSGSVHALQL